MGAAISHDLKCDNHMTLPGGGGSGVLRGGMGVLPFPTAPGSPMAPMGI